MLGRKAGQGAVQRVTVGEESKRIATDGRCKVGERHLDDAPLSAAGFVDGRVHEQAMEPGVEPVGIAQPRQVSPGPDQALLDRVARELGVPEDEASGRVHARSGAPGKHGERVAIAPPCLFHERPLVHGRPLERRDLMVALASYGVRIHGFVSRRLEGVSARRPPHQSRRTDRPPRSTRRSASRENSWSTTIADAPMTPASPPSDDRWMSRSRVASGSDRR